MTARNFGAKEVTYRENSPRGRLRIGSSTRLTDARYADCLELINQMIHSISFYLRSKRCDQHQKRANC